MFVFPCSVFQTQKQEATINATIRERWCTLAARWDTIGSGGFRLSKLCNFQIPGPRVDSYSVPAVVPTHGFQRRWSRSHLLPHKINRFPRELGLVLKSVTSRSDNAIRSTDEIAECLIHPNDDRHRLHDWKCVKYSLLLR